MNKVNINDFDEKIDIFYQGKKIGVCKSLISFADIREQIAKIYSSENEEKKYEDSDYYFEYKGNKIFFRKDSTYVMPNGIDFWEDFYDYHIDEILKIKFDFK